MIPRDTHDGAFYRAVLALHQDLFSLAQQVRKCVQTIQGRKHFCERLLASCAYVYVKKLLNFSHVQVSELREWPWS